MSFAELQSAITAQARAVTAAGGDGAAHHALADLAGAARRLSLKTARRALADAAGAAQGDHGAPGREAVGSEIQAGVFLLEVLTAAGAKPSLRGALEILLQALEQSGVSAGLLAEIQRQRAAAAALAAAERRAALTARQEERARRIACFAELLTSASAERSESALAEALAAMERQAPRLDALEWREIALAVAGRRTGTKGEAKAALKRWIAYIVGAETGADASKAAEERSA